MGNLIMALAAFTGSQAPAKSVVALPETGTADAGIASQPIADVAANDSVNGKPATLGPSGNATVSPIGSWRSGVGLNTETGAVTTTAALAAATYKLPYRLCDRKAPANCAAATDTVVVMPPATEVQVSTVPMVDIEFDWGRDGVSCAPCNDGEGNARFNWTDKRGNLWVGHIDPLSGAFTPPTGNDELADTTAFFSAEFGNGPEWAFSTANGQVLSQLVYARYPPGMPEAAPNAGAAFATQGPSGWSATFFPGTTPISIGGTMTTDNPSASQCNADPVALTYFYDTATPPNVYWEPLSSAAGTAPTLTPLSSYANVHVSGGKPSIRWVPCTHWMVFVGDAPPDASGNVYQQVFWYDIDSQAVQQLTVDAVNHGEAYLFQAPEFGDAYALYTIANGTEIDVYGQTGSAPNGAPTLEVVNRITSTDPAEPYIAGTEPFINCTPHCQTYVFMRLQSEASYGGSAGQNTNGVAVGAIDPIHPLFKILVPQAADPHIQRIDLEYFITANGPYLYYDRSTLTPGEPFVWGNRYYIDMQLGAPSGPCVGSSAEGGLLPGC